MTDEDSALGVWRDESKVQEARELLAPVYAGQSPRRPALGIRLSQFRDATDNYKKRVAPWTCWSRPEQRKILQ
jgi:hypothetical protein